MLSQGGSNLFEHAIDVAQDFVVPEADHAKSFAFKPCSSFIVFRFLGCVLTTINLDHKTTFVT